MAAEDLDSVHRLPAAADDIVDMVVHGQVVGEADSQHLDRVHASDVCQCGWMIGLRLASSAREYDLNRLCSVEMQVVSNSPLSTNFDMKLKLDIGRYEFRSPALSDGFLSRVVTMACFCDVGRIPDCRDALQMLATTGARTAAARLTNHVGTGSSERCLHGALNINLSASSFVIG